MIEVRLEPYEVLVAAEVGVRRRVASLRRGNQDRDYFSAGGLDHWHVDIEGACAELAVAKYLNVHWGGEVNVGKKYDVAGYQVRYTHHKNGRCLVRHKDKDHEEFILVTGRHPVYFIHGKVLGVVAKQDKYIDDPHGVNPAWFVPQSDLTELTR